MATIFRFRMWDTASDSFVMSSRWATRERVEAMGGEIVGGGVEVDEQFVGGEIDGMTTKGFDPKFPRGY